ncbi:MAG: RHS repeat-associated core domain-containing protein [Sumerlaeia bacterium]
MHGLTDETANFVEAYEYTPYGEVTLISDGPDGDTEVNFNANDTRTAGGASAFGNTFAYTGQRFHAQTGLNYYKNRYQNPATGRFLTRDPIGLWGDAANFGNGYAYVGNQPLDYVDELGLANGPGQRGRQRQRERARRDRERRARGEHYGEYYGGKNLRPGEMDLLAKETSEPFPPSTNLKLILG